MSNKEKFKAAASEAYLGAIKSFEDRDWSDEAFIVMSIHSTSDNRIMTGSTVVGKFDVNTFMNIADVVITDISTRLANNFMDEDIPHKMRVSMARTHILKSLLNHHNGEKEE